jgi:hypothetical protein
MAGSDDRSTDPGDDDSGDDAATAEDASDERDDQNQPREEDSHGGDVREKDARVGGGETSEAGAAREGEMGTKPDVEGGAMSAPLGDGADFETEAEAPETETPYLLGLASGVAAWLLGYLVVYLASSGRIRNSIGSQLLNELAGGDATWKLVGWLFFNAHFVDVVLDAPVLGVSTLDLIAQYGGSATYLYAVPPALLLAGGLLIGYDAGTEGIGDATVTGFLLVPGYLLLSVAGALLFTVGSGDATAAPDLVAAILLAGLVYPALFGAVGSALGDQL